LPKFPRWGVNPDDSDIEIQEGPTRASQAPKAQRKGKVTLDDKKWPPETHLYCVVGKTLPLLQQDDRIKAVVRIAITDLLGDLLFEDAFPGHEERIHLSRAALISACKSYQHDTMLQRLQNDIAYLDVVAKVVRRGNITTVIADVTSS
jgi:hypothetical protein